MLEVDFDLVVPNEKDFANAPIWPGQVPNEIALLEHL
jgi:hypothetical protein